MSTAQLTTVTDETRQEAIWFAWWRYLAARGEEPFPAVKLCPCGFAEEVCRCVADDPGKIAYRKEATV